MAHVHYQHPEVIKTLPTASAFGGLVQRFTKRVSQQFALSPDAATGTEQDGAVFLVNADGKSAGILVPAQSGFRFVANAVAFEQHDGVVFATRKEAEHSLASGLPAGVKLVLTFLPHL